MIKGRVKQILSTSLILSKISSYEIYRYYLGQDFKLGKPFQSPMPGRRDSSPSFSISMLGGDLFHMDFGCSHYRGNCFDFVMQSRMVDFITALKMVDNDFGLGISQKGSFHIRTVPMYKIPKMAEKKPSLIQFKGTQRFNKIEQQYWNSYRVSEEILKRENVYGVRELIVDRQRIGIDPHEPTFCYYAPDIDAAKIYRPFAKKAKKEWKWKSSIPFTYLFGLTKLQPCEKVIIAKSMKDRLVLLNITEGVVAVQGESFAALPQEALDKIKSLSTEQYVGFGSDQQAKEASLSITTQLGIKHINMPDHYLPANDFAEVAKLHGIEAVEQHFREKNILPNLKIA